MAAPGNAVELRGAKRGFFQGVAAGDRLGHPDVCRLDRGFLRQPNIPVYHSLFTLARSPHVLSHDRDGAHFHSQVRPRVRIRGARGPALARVSARDALAGQLVDPIYDCFRGVLSLCHRR